jgi:putative two-component system response regulator
MLCCSDVMQPARRPAKLDLSRRTILIVEDSEGDLDLLTAMVELYGARVVASRNGAQALAEATRGQPPDLILCDLVMPGFDGCWLLDRLRSDAKRARIPVIAVTALGSPADVMRTWEAGFSGHLVKPLLPEVLEAHLHRVFWAQDQLG